MEKHTRSLSDKKVTELNELSSENIERYYPELIQLRRDFHRHPEQGWTEYLTTYKIAKYLEELGWEVYIGEDVVKSDARMGLPSFDYLKYCERRALSEGVEKKYLSKMSGGLTGVVAEWKLNEKGEGPITAFRFDMDALDIQESKNQKHVPFENQFDSEYAGNMHACGHDGHITMGLGLARFITENYKQLCLNGTVRLLFQPAEEGCRGALAMVEKGWLDDVDYLLSGHIGFRSFHVGQIVLNTTHILPTTKWDVEFFGRSSHAGGAPELGKNALLAASTATLNLHSIPRHSEGATRVNVGKLVGGSGRNIVPDYAKLELETRGEKENINNYLSTEAVRIVKAAARMYDVDVVLTKMGESGRTTGNPSLVSDLRKVFAYSSYISDIKDSMPLGASEDIVHMMKRVQEKGGQSTYMLFGTPLAEAHHMPEFNFSEEVLKVGIDAYIKSLVFFNS